MNKKIENKILTKIEKSKSKLTPLQVVTEVSTKTNQEQVENSLRDLVIRGKLSISNNWKLSINHNVP